MKSNRLIKFLVFSCAILVLVGCKKDKNTITEYIGTVVEGTTMAPLPNVKVSVANESRVLVSTVTDEEGAFSMYVNFDKVTKRDSLIIDGNPGLPYVKKFELKGMGKEQYDYRTLVLYNKSNTEVKTSEVTSITANSAICGGMITCGADVQIVERGVCWSKSQYPTLESAHTSDGQGSGTFTSYLTNLDEKTDYYVRAYAKTREGNVVYDNEQKPFTTKAFITTKQVTSITANSAVCGGIIAAENDNVVLERGVCWATHEEPKINDPHTSDGQGNGEYISNITGLEEQTIYYVRAYARTESTVKYGDQKVLPTPALLPTFQYAGTTYYVHPDAGKMTWESAVNYCDNLTFAGFSDWFLPDLNELNAMFVNCDPIGGFVTTGNDCKYWSSTKDFSSTWRYWYKDFSTGEQQYTPWSSEYLRVRPVRKDGGGGGGATAPTVITNAVTSFNSSSAICGGNVTSTGGADITECGVYFGTSPNPVTTGQKKPSNTSGSGNFTCDLTGLLANTKYYYCAYAINSVDEAHGNNVESFTTLSGPSAPIGVSAEVSGSRIKVSWRAVSNAMAYYVYWSNDGNTYTNIGNTDETYFFDNAAYEDNYYKVKTLSYSGEVSPFSDPAYCHYSSGGGGSAPSAPTGVSATVSGSRIIVSWNSVSNADEYTVYWSNDGSTYGDIGTTSDLYFYDDVPYEDNYYKVKAKNSYGESPFSSPAYCHYSSSGHVEGWLQYDDGNGIGTAGFPDGGTIYWADMFPASMLSQYDGTRITKVEANFNKAGVYTLKIYTGGTTAPGTLVFQQNFNHNYSTNVWATMTLSNPVSLNTSQNLWIVISTTHSAGESPIGYCQYYGGPNGSWYSDGIDWGVDEDCTWGMHTFVSNGVKGEMQIGNKQQSKSETSLKKKGNVNVSKHGIIKR